MFTKITIKIIITISIVLLCTTCFSVLKWRSWESKYYELRTTIDNSSGELVDDIAAQRKTIESLQSDLSAANTELTSARNRARELEDSIGGALDIAEQSNDRLKQLDSELGKTGGDFQTIINRQQRINDLAVPIIRDYQKATEQLRNSTGQD